jgi:hypothetical protein
MRVGVWSPVVIQASSTLQVADAERDSVPRADPPTLYKDQMQIAKRSGRTFGRRRERELGTSRPIRSTVLVGLGGRWARSNRDRNVRAGSGRRHRWRCEMAPLMPRSAPSTVADDTTKANMLQFHSQYAHTYTEEAFERCQVFGSGIESCVPTVITVR